MNVDVADETTGGADGSSSRPQAGSFSSLTSHENYAQADPPPFSGRRVGSLGEADQVEHRPVDAEFVGHEAGLLVDGPPA